jgi:hypothetical protein
MSLLLFLTHHIRYNIKRRITCGSRPMRQLQSSQGREDFHTGRGLVQLVPKTRPRRDHDFSDTRVAFSTHLTACKESPRRRAHAPTSPEQLNVEADHRATVALDALRAAKQTTEFYPLPAASLSPRRHITSREIRSEPNFLSTNSSKTKLV